MLRKLRKGDGHKDNVGTVEDAMEGSPGFPRDFSVASLRERRLLMALRLVGFSLFAAIILAIVEAFLLVSLMPMKEIRPFLVQVSNEGSVVASIKPIQDTFEAKDILTEKLVREYVVNRHEILRSTPIMQNRWSRTGYIGSTTDDGEYARFAASVSDTLERIRANGAQRRAKVISVSTIEAGHIYIVDFQSTSYDSEDRKIDEAIYSATLEVEFRPLDDLTREQMLINPTGFTVVHYSLAEKNQ